MLSIKKYAGLYVFLWMWTSMIAQTTGEQDVIDRAMKSYPSMQLANLEIQKQKAFERTAFNPRQPQFAIETPADMGIAFDIEQQFDFPGVYSRQSKLLKSRTRLVTEGANLTKYQLKQDIRLAYLDAQVAQAKVIYLTKQDSLWKEIASKSLALFDRGEINRADLLFAESQSGKVSYSLITAQTEAANALSLLSTYVNEKVLRVDDIVTLPVEDTLSEGFYFDNYLAENNRLTVSEINLVKAQRLPGLVLGYLRSPERDTDFRYRYKIGVTVPLWQSQYKGEIEAGKKDLQIKETQGILQRQQASIARLQWQRVLAQTTQSLDWFQNIALPRMDQLVTTYLRLYEGGDVDFALTLRNIADVLQLQDQYLEALQQHNQAVIQLAFLSGK